MKQCLILYKQKEKNPPKNIFKKKNTKKLFCCLIYSTASWDRQSDTCYTERRKTKPEEKGVAIITESARVGRVGRTPIQPKRFEPVYDKDSSILDQNKIPP
jgi:hypothetical protein